MAAYFLLLIKDGCQQALSKESEFYGSSGARNLQFRLRMSYSKHFIKLILLGRREPPAGVLDEGLSLLWLVN